MSQIILEIFCYQYNFCGMRATEYLLLNFCGTRATKLFPFSMLERIMEKSWYFSHGKMKAELNIYEQHIWMWYKTIGKMFLYTHEYRIESWHAGNWEIYKVFRYVEKHEILEKKVRYIECWYMEVYIWNLGDECVTCVNIHE